ncbi:MAG: Lrp/AsnC family transcriptional regulator [Kiritimatiellia bacterium]|jgi:Lrp/AsnC family transcriptional regulator for asnA, asnC and gidA|nr:Lrp/AsnC family transcriptional regulator [Kiritimatiellia bacterium]MDP6631343.1 Lrp/AsnC family transcriptional regulator [Kiritimatiellia bacterium]MDP6809675.1 Lrp/AsnC family transcriptional regulator [Kiritimatiellia bacterium]MDP7023475.1 Lrp/AsnC family transcriptional regulator [Kiritimatiellia bacterium]
MTPDKTDWDIINALSAGNMANTDLARKMGVSESTVRQRVKRLQNAGILKIRALRDPNRLAAQQLAMVAVSVTESRLLDTKAREIAELDHVLSASVISGQYDIMIEVLVDSNRGLISFLTEELSQIEGLTRTETFLILHSYNKWV